MHLLSSVLLAVTLLVAACHAQEGGPHIVFPPPEGDLSRNCLGFAAAFCLKPPANYRDWAYLEARQGVDPCSADIYRQRCSGRASKWCGLHLEAFCQGLRGGSDCIDQNKRKCGG